MKKNVSLYATVATVWVISILAFIGFSVYSAIDIFANPSKSLAIKIVTGILLTTNVFILAFMWFNAVRDICSTTFYFAQRKKLKKMLNEIAQTKIQGNPKVVFLYCTCNDFDQLALKKSINQNYQNLKIVILDDSSKPEFRQKVDDFAKEHNCQVFRRPKRRAFKAGALNEWLCTHTDEFDYFAVLDKDGVLPSNFCDEMLKYFFYDSKIGAVQAFHSPTQNENVFQDVSALELLGLNQISYPLKNRYGAPIVQGHGTMISKKAFLEVGSFPEVVSEDLGFTMKLMQKGFQVAFAPNVMCQEEYPIDYLAFKKRNCRWIEGQIQCLKAFSKDFLKTKNAKWYEKLDVFWYYFLLPIFMPSMGFLMLINMAVLGAVDSISYWYSLITSIMISLSFVTLLINNIFVHKGKQKWKIIPYFLESMILYTSTLPAVLYATISTFFGKKPYFVITSNQSNKFGFKDMVKHTWVSFVFGVALLLMGIFFCKSIFAVLIVSIACCAAPFLLLLTNIKIKKKQVPIKNFFVDKQKISKRKRKQIKQIVEKSFTA